jgi:hypothetical protein
MTHHFKQHEGDLKKLLKSQEFLESLHRDVFKGVNEVDVKGILESAVACIVRAPQGVGKMEATKKYPHIKNSMWKDMCRDLLRWLENNEKEGMEAAAGKSSLHKQFGAFWPSCDIAMQEVMDGGLAPGGGVALRRSGAVKKR